MDRYEIMFIVKNTIEEEKVKKIADSLKDLITNDKGNIIDFKEMGKRKLDQSFWRNGWWFYKNRPSRKRIYRN